MNAPQTEPLRLEVRRVVGRVERRAQVGQPRAIVFVAHVPAGRVQYLRQLVDGSPLRSSDPGEGVGLAYTLANIGRPSTSG